MRKRLCLTSLLILFSMIFILLFLGFFWQASAKDFKTGFIKEVDLEKKTIIIDGNKYNISDETVITVNNHEASLKSCFPPAEGIYQFGEAFIKDGEILQLNTYYHIMEGIIKKIDNKEDYIVLEVFSTPENDGANKKYSIADIKKREGSNDGIFKLAQIKEEKYIVVAVGYGNILYFF